MAGWGPFMSAPDKRLRLTDSPENNAATEAYLERPELKAFERIVLELLSRGGFVWGTNVHTHVNKRTADVGIKMGHGQVGKHCERMVKSGLLVARQVLPLENEVHYFRFFLILTTSSNFFFFSFSHL